MSILNVLAVQYQANIELHKENIKIFMANPVGVAEHINYAESIEKELTAIATNMDLLEALEEVNK